MQTIESYWNRIKTKLKTTKEVRREMLPGYLNAFMWRERAGDNKFEAICGEISGVTNLQPTTTALLGATTSEKSHDLYTQ